MSRKFCLQLVLAFGISSLLLTRPSLAEEKTGAPTVAAIVTEYRRNTHADVIVGRILQTVSLDDQGSKVKLRLASLFTDQVPKNDLSRSRSMKYGFPIFDSVSQALAAGGNSPIGVDGIIVVAEHGKYPKNEFGNTIYPKRRLFEQIAKAVRASGKKGVPIFSDKHLADNWTDAKWIYDTAKSLQMPMMAGSSLPVCWRYPQTDVKRGSKLRQIVGVSYGSLDSYGFHGVEMLQCLAERRAGGETGVKSVQTLSGDAVWEAARMGVYQRRLLDAAISRLRTKLFEKRKKTLEQSVPNPSLFIIDYQDGLRACLFTLNGAVAEWSAAWEYADQSIDSTLFALQYDRPYSHFTNLVRGIEKMMHTGKATWPVERTLISSGVLDAALISKTKAGKRIDTPYLNVKYSSDFDWKQPLPPSPAQK